MQFWITFGAVWNIRQHGIVSTEHKDFPLKSCFVLNHSAATPQLVRSFCSSNILFIYPLHADGNIQPESICMLIRYQQVPNDSLQG